MRIGITVFPFRIFKAQILIFTLKWTIPKPQVDRRNLMSENALKGRSAFYLLPIGFSGKKSLIEQPNSIASLFK